MSSFTRLKRVATLRAGGTPSVDDPVNWSDDDSDGTPWVSISDMSDGSEVTSTSRCVTCEGLSSRRLPVGAPGTLLFAMYASVGAVAELGTRATWNQALLGITPRDGLSHQRFIRYWLEHLRTDLGALVRSNTQDNLNAEQVGNFPFPTFPVSAQQAIADYLDTETAHIDALIAKKQRMIDLLEQRRIQRESDLVAECDETSQLPLSSLFRITKGIDAQRLTVEYCAENFGKYPVYSGQTSGVFGTINDYDFSAPDGAIVVSTVGARVMNQTVVRGQFSLSQNCLVMIPHRPKQIVVEVFVPQLRLLFERLRSSIPDHMQPSLRVDDLKGSKLAVPPFDEQLRLAASLDHVRESSAATVDLITRQIGLLREHRQALITAAVTGEFEVPGVAA